MNTTAARARQMAANRNRAGAGQQTQSRPVGAQPAPALEEDTDQGGEIEQALPQAAPVARQGRVLPDQTPRNTNGNAAPRTAPRAPAKPAAQEVEEKEDEAVFWFSMPVPKAYSGVLRFASAIMESTGEVTLSENRRDARFALLEAMLNNEIERVMDQYGPMAEEFAARAQSTGRRQR